MKTNSKHKTFTRDVGKQSSGFYYQKQRALLHIFDTLKRSKEFYFAVEYLDDVYGKIFIKKSCRELIEQDKLYNVTSSFSFVREEIYKSMSNYIDKWLDNNRSPAMTFLFVSTNQITKENNTKIIKELGITLPDKPILELINDRTYQSDEKLLESIKKIIIYFYTKIYKEKDEEGFLEEIINLENDCWIKFLNQIEYLFGQGDSEETKTQGLSVINQCELFNESHIGTEKSIYAQTICLLDEKQNKDYPANFVNYSDIKDIFREVSHPLEVKKEDNAWEIFDTIDVKSSRNIGEKILAVNKSFSVGKLDAFKLQITASLLEEKGSTGNDFKAQKFRVFLKCCDVLSNKFNLNKKEFLEESEIIEIIDELVSSASESLMEYSKTYNYPYNNRETTRGIVLNLFNECYLAFDEVE